MHRHFRLLVAAVFITGCESSPFKAPLMDKPSPADVLLTAPEPGYRLTNAERARIPQAINVDTLEAFLARIRPQYRRELIDALHKLASEGSISFGPASSSIDDPELNSLLRNIAAQHKTPPLHEPDH